jgi:hypothetical protein
MEPTPWTDRLLDIRLKNKKAGMEARGKAGFGRVAGTNPSHPLADFTGEYEHPAYGTLKIGMKSNQLQFDFHKIVLPLSHFHYDRFDSPDDEENGKWSINFATNPQATSTKPRSPSTKAKLLLSVVRQSSTNQRATDRRHLPNADGRQFSGGVQAGQRTLRRASGCPRSKADALQRAEVSHSGICRCGH